ncbi:MAG: hypothetical protein H6635_01885 [Anaerolineales bacterium]|nr:hypothetical protein [Anaerolineales bacterium]
MKRLLPDAFVLIFLALWAVALGGCLSKPAATPPSDFFIVLDARSEDRATNINLRIDSQGDGQFERYDTGGTILYDENNMVMYDQAQVVDKGTFQLSAEQLRSLWNTINSNGFFQLEDDYRMSIGYSYAFISIEANGQKHIVDNIGMEVTEVRAIVKSVNSMLPANIKIIYGEGYIW